MQGENGTQGTQGIQSIEVGGRLLSVLAECNGPAPLSALAEAADMPSSKARRYLVSLIRVGLVSQDRDTGHYIVGPMAMRLGLAAQRSVDVVREGGEIIAGLASELNHTAALIIWSDRGPLVVRFVASQHNVAIFVRLGSVVPLLRSAAGQLFLAHLPASLTASLLDEELSGDDAEPAWRDPATREQRLQDVRGGGFAVAPGTVVPGIHALAAPAFDSSGQMAAAVIVYGPENAINLSGDGAVARATMSAAATLSERLGAS